METSMRVLIRILSGICLGVGVLCLGLALLGMSQMISDSGQTTKVGSGEFATNMPKTTVFQEIEVSLIGILGATLLAASAGFEVAIRSMMIQDQIATSAMGMERRLDDLRIAQQVPKPQTPPAAPVLRQIGDEEHEAGNWFDMEPEPVTPPLPTVAEAKPEKLKAKCGICGKVVSGGADWAGRKGKCPHCKAPIQFPALVTA
jgi:hypothetical protein